MGICNKAKGILCKTMCYCIKRESGLSIATKSVTIIGIFFGIYAYFNTVHPVFQKEKQLIKLEEEKTSLVLNIDELDKRIETEKSIVSKIETQKAELQKELQHLSSQKASLENALEESKSIISEKENEIQKIKSTLTQKQGSYEELLSQNKNAGYAAVHANIEVIRGKLLREYASTAYGHNAKFDILEVANKLIQQQKHLHNNPWKNNALSFFESYVTENFYGDIQNDNIAELIIAIPYDYVTATNENKKTITVRRTIIKTAMSI